MKSSQLSRLNDCELLAQLTELVQASNRNLASLLRHLAEFDRRRLYLEQACSSLFSYCVQRLGFSESATYNRITAARLGRRCPVVFDHIEAGRLHLSAIRLLAPHLTDENHAELLTTAAGKSKRELEHLLAASFPKPDVPTRVRKLPASSPRGELQPPTHASGATTASANGASAPTPAEPPAPVPPAPLASPRPPPAPSRDRLQPLSPSRYKVQFTASAELARKIDEARELASHHVRGGDLAQLIEKALDLFITHEKKRRFAETPKPGSRPRPAKPAARHIPADVRRAVWARDQGRCSYVDERGRRCDERRYLEFDHEQPHARGGEAIVDNIRLLCRAHNQQRARESYGADYVEERVRFARSLRRRPTKLSEPRRRVQLPNFELTPVLG